MPKQEWIDTILSTYKFSDQKQARNELNDYWDKSGILQAIESEYYMMGKTTGDFIGITLSSLLGYTSLPSVYLSCVAGSFLLEELLARGSSNNLEYSAWIQELEMMLRQAKPDGLCSQVLHDSLLLLRKNISLKYQRDSIEYTVQGLAAIVGVPSSINSELDWVSRTKKMELASLLSIGGAFIANRLVKTLFKPVTLAEAKEAAMDEEAQLEDKQNSHLGVRKRQVVGKGGD